MKISSHTSLPVLMISGLGGKMFRFKREEAKIQAWENHEKAKAEAEMRRIEVTISLNHI